MGLFAKYPMLTDVGNAERFASVSGNDFRWCSPWQKWLHWDGTRWSPDDREITTDTAMKFIRYCRGIAGQTEDRKQREEILAFLQSCEGRGRLAAMIELVRAKLPIIPDELDADPMLFNVKNGTIDLKTGEMKPHDRADGITQVSPVEYDPFAECPKWKAFLSEIMLGRQELIDFLQTLAGYCLTGRTSEQIFAILYGLGRNGKTVLINVLLHIIGDYAREMPSEMLMIRKNEGVPNDLAALRGRRLITCSESEGGGRLAESRVKALTGQDMITARFLFGEYFTFTPTFKLLLRTNHKPRIRGSDHAIWRRIALIPFEYRVPEEKVNPNLEAALIEEAPGILNWAIEGCLRWQREKLIRPDVIQAATEAYKEAEDILGDFLRENTIPDKDGRIKSGELYKTYNEWTQANGARQISQKAFSESMEEHGYEKIKGRDFTYWLGIMKKGENDA